MSTMTKEKGISPTLVLTDLKPNQKTNRTKSQIQFSVKMNFASECQLLLLKKKSADVTSMQVRGREVRTKEVRIGNEDRRGNAEAERRN